MLHFRRRGDKLAVLHAFCGDQFAGDLVHFVTTTPNDNDLETVMLVEMDVQARIDRNVSLVLHVG